MSAHLAHIFYGLSDRPELARILWAASVVAGIVYSGWHLVQNAQFNIIEFGTGMGILLAGGGAGTAMKDTAVAKARLTTTGGGAE